LRVQPDAVLAVIEYLRGVSELTALVPAAKIVSAIPAQGTAYPYIVVQRAGGTGVWPAFDRPSIQIDAVGGTKYECGHIARVIRAAIWAIANDVVDAGVLVSGTDEVAPQWFPDTVPTPPLSRYVARYSVLLHP
jgi:hypothetical protein